MIRRPPRPTRTDTRLPYTTLCRTAAGRRVGTAMVPTKRNRLIELPFDDPICALRNIVNRRAIGTPYRRAKGTPLHDGARLIGHAPLRCARRREGGDRPEARAAQDIFKSGVGRAIGRAHV